MYNWIEDIESRPVVDKAQINWAYTTEFEIQGKYFVNLVQTSTSLLKGADDETLMSIAMQCSNVLGWIKQMHVMGFLSLGEHVERLLEENLDDSRPIEKLQEKCIELWNKNKRGQHKVGENYFNILDNKFYLRSLSGEWTEIRSSHIFDIFPEGDIVNDTLILAKLQATYEPTPYDMIYREWQNFNSGKEIDPALLSKQSGNSTPEDVLASSIRKIKLILQNPPSLKKIAARHSGGKEFVEKMIKVSLIMSCYVQERRNNNEHTLYLLRDCVMFNELHHTLDIIEQKPTSHDQLYVGRKILSNKKREGGHWYVAQELLLLSCLASPLEFGKFDADYTEKMREFENSIEDFRTLVKELVPYIEKHIGERDSRLPIRIVDLGFQGSINMILKYILETHFDWADRRTVDINMFVVAEWFKPVYGKSRYSNVSYSLLTFIEDTARNEYLYDYVPAGFNGDSLSVKMGTPENQENAALELIVAVVTTQIAHKLGML